MGRRIASESKQTVRGGPKPAKVGLHRRLVLPVPDYRLRYLTLTLSHIIIHKPITIVFLSHVPKL